MVSKARQLAQSASAPEGRKNIIINGAMQVAQRATSVTGVSGSGYHTVDRFDTSMTSDGRYTQSQVTDAPEGFGHALKFDCTTADTSIAAGENLIGLFQIEGQDVQTIQKGTSSAKEVTVSFYAKANAAKTYVCELKDFTNTRTCSKTFTVGTSYARHEITFPADTTGAITSDNARQFAINLWLHAGSTYTGGTLQTAWGAQSNADRAAGIDSFFSSTDNTFFITGVQLEVGSVATEFETRSFGEELALCQRYYQKSYPLATAPGTAITDGFNVQASFGTEGSGIVGQNVTLPVVMRTNPTTTVYDGEGTSGKVNLLGSGAATTHNQATNMVSSRAEFINVRIFGATCAGMSFMYESDAEL